MLGTSVLDRDTYPADLTARTLGDVAELLPHALGYVPGEGFGLLGVRDETVVAAAAWTWPEHVTRTEQLEILARVEDSVSIVGADRYFLVSYNGWDAARGLESMELTFDGNPVEVIVVDEDGDTWVLGRAGEEAEREWQRTAPMRRGYPAQLATAGLSYAPTQEAFVAAAEPLPGHGFTQVSAEEAAAIESLLPSDRAHEAVAHLDELASFVAPDPRRQARVAALIASHPVVRDAVLLAAVYEAPAPVEDDRTSVLLGIYRAAPPSLRSDMAAIAGTAAYLRTGNTLTTATILSHVTGDGPAADLGDLVTDLIYIGSPPAEALSTLQQRTNIEAELTRADLAFYAAARQHRALPDPDQQQHPWERPASIPYVEARHETLRIGRDLA